MGAVALSCKRNAKGKKKQDEKNKYREDTNHKKKIR